MNKPPFSRIRGLPPIRSYKTGRAKKLITAKAEQLLSRSFILDEESSITTVLDKTDEILSDLATRETYNLLTTSPSPLEPNLSSVSNNRFDRVDPHPEAPIELEGTGGLDIIAQRAIRIKLSLERIVIQILPDPEKFKKFSPMLSDFYRKLRNLVLEIVRLIVDTGYRWISAYIAKCPLRFEEIRYDNCDLLLESA